MNELTAPAESHGDPIRIHAVDDAGRWGAVVDVAVNRLAAAATAAANSAGTQLKKGKKPVE